MQHLFCWHGRLCACLICCLRLALPPGHASRASRASAGAEADGADAAGACAARRFFFLTPCACCTALTAAAAAPLPAASSPSSLLLLAASGCCCCCRQCAAQPAPAAHPRRPARPSPKSGWPSPCAVGNWLHRSGCSVHALQLRTYSLMRRASSDCSDALSASGRPAAECSSRTLPCPNAAMRAPPRHQLTPRAMHATQQRLAQAPPAAPAPARSLCCCRRSARPPAATAAASSASIRQLLDAADGQRWGATATPQQRQQVLGLVAELKAAASAAAAAGDSSSSSAPTAGPLDGDWQLVWTTEASVHQLAGGQLLGLAVEDIRQRVCLK